MATTKLVQNTAGDFIEVPGADLDATGAATGTGTGALRKSAFRSDQDANIYHEEVPITGGVVYVREMSDEHFERLLDLQNAFKDFAQSAASDEARARDIEAKQPDEAATIRAASMKGVQEIRAKAA